MPASPSPLSTLSIAPAPCATIASAVNEALCPPTAMKQSGRRALLAFGEIDDLRHVGEIIAREGDRLRPPALDDAEIRGVVLDLQIDQPAVVSGRARRGRDEFEPERLEPQKHAGVEQGAGVDEEDAHAVPRDR
jgi:hypothetical protein